MNNSTEIQSTSQKGMGACTSKPQKKILVVDDEASIRATLEFILTQNGYLPICAINGLDAYNKYCDLKDEISLIILDMIMPVMSGKECFEKLIQINPSLKFLLVTGYACDEEISYICQKGAANCLKKPFKKTDLLNIIDTLIN